MLGQRVITAVALLALLLPALFAESLVPFALLTVLMISAAGWEWGRLNGLSMGKSLALGAAVGASCVLAWRAGWATAAPPAAWWVACGCWVLGGSAALRAGPAAWPRLSRGARLWVGWLVLSVAWLALAAAKSRGVGFILSALCLVWMAHRGLLRRPGIRSTQAGAIDQPGQELGGCLVRHGRGGSAVSWLDGR